MIRARVIIVAALSASALLVVGYLVWRTFSGDGFGTGAAATRPGVVRIRVVTALPVEEWVRAAADEFSATSHGPEEAAIEIEVIPMDGLVALGKWERNDFAALKTGVLPEDLPLDEFEALNSFLRRGLPIAAIWWILPTRQVGNGLGKTGSSATASIG